MLIAGIVNELQLINLLTCQDNPDEPTSSDVQSKIGRVNSFVVGWCTMDFARLIPAFIYVAA